MRTLLARHPRLVFFLLGLAITAASFWTLVYWLEVAQAVGMRVVYDTRPAWLRVTMVTLQWLPVIAVAVVVLLRFVVGRAVRPLPFIGGVVAHGAAIAAFFLFGDVVADHWHRRRFEAAGWMRNDQANIMWPTRLTMVDDLLSRHRLTGLTRDSVERMLGPADQSSSWREWDLVYHLGPERGFIRIDSEWLVVKLGSDGRVRDYRIVRD